MDDRVRVDERAPWHAGEVALQRRAGVAERMAEVGGRIIRDHMIEQHRAFYPLLPFVVAGAVDPAGDVWATLIAGEPGFLASPDPWTLTVAAARDPSDPADAGIGDGDAVGLLGIEPHTRRRNRLNGAIRRRGVGGFEIAVAESFGNCPRYIRPRELSFARSPSVPSPASRRWLEALDGRARAMIAAADTFFIATYVDRDDGRRQVDVSHRGGPAGFVAVDDAGVLTIPDYAGNLFFNTLGNIVANPRAGLVFVDFTTGDLLQLTGEGEVVLDGPEVAAVPGAQRLLRFRPRRIAFRPGAFPLRWIAGDESGAGEPAG